MARYVFSESLFGGWAMQLLFTKHKARKSIIFFDVFIFLITHRNI